MDSPSPTAVTYLGLPVSTGGAHSLRMPLRRAYERTISFLETCTEVTAPLDKQLTVMDVPGLEPIATLSRELERRFGASESVRVTDEQVDDALGFLTEIDPQPENEWGMAPIWFTAECRFRVIDPTTGRPLPGQDPARFGGAEYEWGLPLGINHLNLSLSNRATLAIDLSLPDIHDDALTDLVTWLQSHLPCKLSQKHWRRWTATKTGKFQARKIPKPSP